MSAPVPGYYNHPRPEVVARFDPKGLRVLDVGCAGGAMGALMMEKGAAEVVGVEREHTAVQLARTRLSTVYRCDLDSLPTLPYSDGYFDAITCADVLEHLVDPGAVLKHLRRYLKDGGLLVSSIPNIRHESVLLPLLVHGRFSYEDAGVLDRTHLRFFTLSSYGTFLRDAGFTMNPQVGAVSSPPSESAAGLAEMVETLGGSSADFRTETVAVQYVVLATPTRQLAELGFGTGVTPAQCLRNQWAGSKAFRVLLAPDFMRSDDTWRQVLNGLIADPTHAAGITIGLAVEPKYLDQPPEGLAAFAQKANCDLLLTDTPTEPFAWERLMAGASLFIDTAGRSTLRRLACKVGVEVKECGPKPEVMRRSTGSVDAAGLYLDLLKKALLNTIYEDGQLNAAEGFHSGKREVGLDGPLQAHTMIGRKRLDNLQWCVETALADGVPGDFIETGVWRGGATILMRGILKAWGIDDRRVFVADSFAGLPPPNPTKYPADAGDRHYTFQELAMSIEQVQSHFAKYDLLDPQVVFLKGWFKDTLPSAPISALAVVRLDGDMYESTMDAITTLYPKLAIGGFLIIDDYGAVPACQKAIADYRAAHGISEPIVAIDWTGAYWRRTR